MSARPHIIYFPLVWMDVAKTIADDFQKKKKKSPMHIPTNLYNMISCALSECFLEQLGESWIFISHIQTFLPHLCDTNCKTLSLTAILTAPIILLFSIFSRAICNSVKQFKGTVVLCIPIKNCSTKMPPMQEQTRVLSSLPSASFFYSTSAKLPNCPFSNLKKSA